ncbi:PepSY-associated TM helix domain-containing protein [Kordiimonas pumila]|uniref:PepSY-associated TM helix domain-containing protein n=1 Tax=Kordiimonas pumila TaxID=2161677 RepID=A0ABV7D8L9_9PROT|nr:PepSY-associated TM helix domain-containing protein [Kordiimonas pumila]
MKNLFTRLWASLVAVFALLLLMVSITGSMQAFYYEIDYWLNPTFYDTDSTGFAQAPADLILALETQVPEAEVWYLQVPKSTGKTVMLAASPRYNDRTGTYATLTQNYFYMDPVTGDITGARTWGACCFENDNLMNFTYELHHSLADSGETGFWVMGITACIWVLTCLALIYSGISKHTLVGFSPRSALVMGILMLPLAISSVAMNFSEEVFKPAVSALSPVKPTIYEEYAAKDQTDFGHRNLSYTGAYTIAAELGQKRGWQKPIGELFYSRSYNFYGMAFGYRDPSGMGNNWLYISGDDGSVVGEKTPASGTAGDLINYTQLPLHSGRILGIWSQIAICLAGLLTAFFAVRLITWAAKKLTRP